MLVIFALQLIVPLVLLGWIAFVAPRSALGFCVQSAATLAVLIAAGLTGLWLLPPWWWPWVCVGLLVTAVLHGWRGRYPFNSRLPLGWLAWIFTSLFIANGSWGTYQSTIALAGRAPPPGVLVELAAPLKGGTYLMVNGGSNLNVNAHLMTLDASMARFHAFRGQSYGVDIVKLDRWGLRANGLLPPQPSAYGIYGEQVYAPCTGQVVAALDGVPDMQVPQMDRQHMAGNHVLLRCKNADVLLGHFKTGSVKVATGQQLTVGQPIANVGNSGNTGEPHLHIHAQRAGTAAEPLSGDPLPVRFNGRFLVRNDRVSAP